MCARARGLGAKDDKIREHQNCINIHFLLWLCKWLGELGKCIKNISFQKYDQYSAHQRKRERERQTETDIQTDRQAFRQTD